MGERIATRCPDCGGPVWRRYRMLHGLCDAVLYSPRLPGDVQRVLDAAKAFVAPDRACDPAGYFKVFDALREAVEALDHDARKMVDLRKQEGERS